MTNNLFKYKPYFTVSTSISLLFIYFGCILFHKPDDINDISPYIELPLSFRLFSKCNECKDLRYQVWRLFTYSIVHLNVEHILNNLIILNILGLVIEMIEGHKVIFLIYIISIILGALSTAYFKPYVNIIGCSSGVYGVFGSCYSLIIINFKLFDKCIQIISFFIMFLLIVLHILIYEFKRGNRVGHYIHLVGFVYGVNIGFIILKPKEQFIYNRYLKYFGIGFSLTFTILFLYDYITLTSAKSKIYKDECCYIR